jgi:hypothetical protein
MTLDNGPTVPPSSRSVPVWLWTAMRPMPVRYVGRHHDGWCVVRKSLDGNSRSTSSGMTLRECAAELVIPRWWYVLRFERGRTRRERLA